MTHAKKWEFRAPLNIFLPLIDLPASHFGLQETCQLKMERTTWMTVFYPSPTPLCPFCSCQQRLRDPGSQEVRWQAMTHGLPVVCVCVCVCVCALLSEYVCVIMLAGFVGAVRAQHIVQQAAILQNTGEEMTQGGGSFLSTGVCSLHECANRELTVKGVRLCHAASVNKRSRGPHKHRDKQSKLSFNSWLNPDSQQCHAGSLQIIVGQSQYGTSKNKALMLTFRVCREWVRPWCQVAQ